jgi:hypothetical protein
MDSGISNIAGRQLTRDCSVQNNLSEKLTDTKDKDSKELEHPDVPADSFVSGKSSDKNETAVDEKELTVLYYLQGDSDLSESMAEQIVDLERIGSTDDINMVVQFERNIPGEKRLEEKNLKKEDLIDDAWEATRRYFIIKNENPDFEEITLDKLIALSEKYPDNPSFYQDIAKKYAYMGDEENAAIYKNKHEELMRNIPPDINYYEKYGSVYGAAIEEEFGNINNLIQFMSGYDRAGLKEISSEVIEEFPTIEKGEHKTDLQNYIEWGIKNHPAKNYIVAVFAHGEASRGAAHMSPSEMSEALTEGVENANKQTGRDDSIDAIVFNSCLMGSLEAVTELKDNADFIIASEAIANTDVAYQWDNILSDVQDKIDETGHFDTRQFADDYVNYFKPFNNDGFFEKGFCTLCALDTKKIPELNERFNKLLETCNDEGVTDKQLFSAAVDAQNFDSDADDFIHDSKHLKDFGDFVQNIQDIENISEPVKEAAGEVLEKLEEAIISEQHIKGKTSSHTSEIENATGLTIWVPENPIYHEAYTTFHYKHNVPEFHKDSLWDERMEQAVNNIPEELRYMAEYKRILVLGLENYENNNLSPDYPEERLKEIKENPNLKKEAEELAERICFHNYTPDVEIDNENLKTLPNFGSDTPI